MNKKLLITFILIIAAFLRFYNITELPPGFYPDEAIYANNGVEAWETASPTGGFKVFYPENNGREGLWPNIIGFFVVKFGHEPWVPRSIAAIFGILTVAGVYFLTKELFRNDYEIRKAYETTKDNISTFSYFRKNFVFRSENIALLSAFLIATSFWHILFSRIGFRAIMAPVFLTWSLYLLIKSMNQIKNKFQAPSTKSQTISNNQNSNNQNGFGISNFRNWNLFGNWKLRFGILAILAGLLYGLGFHSYIAYRATPLLILVILFLYWLKIKNSMLRTSDVQNIENNSGTSDVPKLKKLIHKKILLVAFLFSISTFIVAAPLVIYFIQNPQDFFGRTTQISIFNSATPIRDLAFNTLATAGMFNFIGDFNWRHNIAGRPELFWPVGIMFLIGVIWGIKSILRTSDVPNIDNNFRTSDVQKLKFGFLILFAWLIIAAIPVIISNEGMPHALRAILMAPAVFILAGVGGIYLYELIKSLMLRTSDVPNINVNVRTSDVQKLNYTKLRKIIVHTSLFIILSLFVFEAYYTYFIKWGKNPNVQGAFSADYVKIGRELDSLPKELPKYVIVEALGVDVRGIPMPAQTVMFITDTFTREKQKEKNIYYVLPREIDKIPENSYTIILQ